MQYLHRMQTKGKLLVEPNKQGVSGYIGYTDFIDCIADARKISIHFNPENRDSLLKLGMIFSFNIYSISMGMIPKEITLTRRLKKTPYKSHVNILLDMSEHEPDFLNSYELHNQGFLISPVRESDTETYEQLEAWRKEEIETKAYSKIHYPLKDTVQDKDPIGSQICRDNLEAMANAETTYIHYLQSSKGSIFDVGMYIMLKYLADRLLKVNQKREFKVLNEKNIDSSGYCSLLMELVHT